MKEKLRELYQNGQAGITPCISEAENVGGNGDGIKFAMAMSDAVNDDGSSWESPAI